MRLYEACPPIEWPQPDKHCHCGQRQCDSQNRSAYRQSKSNTLNAGRWAQSWAILLRILLRREAAASRPPEPRNCDLRGKPAVSHRVHYGASVRRIRFEALRFAFCGKSLAPARCDQQGPETVESVPWVRSGSLTTYHPETRPANDSLRRS